MDQLRDGTTKGDYKHPELWQQYPELAETKLFMERNMASNEMGAYDPVKNTASINDNMTPDEKRSTFLHEVGAHGPQGIEKMPRGGDPKQFAVEKVQAYERIGAINKKMDATLAKKEQMERMSREISNSTDMDRFQQADAMADVNRMINRHQNDYDNLMVERGKLVPAAQQDPFESYQSLTGEAEARAVEVRRDMTMKERLARPFWLDFDKAGSIDKQHTRYR